MLVKMLTLTIIILLISSFPMAVFAEEPVTEEPLKEQVEQLVEEIIEQVIEDHLTEQPIEEPVEDTRSPFDPEVIIELYEKTGIKTSDYDKIIALVDSLGTYHIQEERNGKLFNICRVIKDNLTVECIYLLDSTIAGIVAYDTLSNLMLCDIGLNGVDRPNELVVNEGPGFSTYADGTLLSMFYENGKVGARWNTHFDLLFHAQAIKFTYEVIEKIENRLLE